MSVPVEALSGVLSGDPAIIAGATTTASLSIRQRSAGRPGGGRGQGGFTPEGIEEVTISTSRIGETRFDKSSLGILKFPESLEADGSPYVLFKVFESVDGPVEINDRTTQSIRAGAETLATTAQSVIPAVPGAEGTVGAIAGAAAIGGITGAAIGFGVTTQAGQDLVNNAGAALLGVDNIISRSKELVKNFTLKRNIEQLRLGIALFMPDGINTSYDNEYEALSVTGTLGAVGFGAQALAAKNGAVDETNAFIAEAASSILGRIAGNEDLTKLGVFATTGRVINPQLEMLYTSPVLRKFTFDFRMIPRNEAESASIYNIISRLKYFASPTIPDNSTGRYFIPPAQFEIEFYDGKNNLNTFLFRTKKCVLSGINVDYSPNGFSTFRNGAPVETRLQLTFQETVIIDRNAVNEGY